jgi:hypothetical protein
MFTINLKIQTAILKNLKKIVVKELFSSKNQSLLHFHELKFLSKNRQWIRFQEMFPFSSTKSESDCQIFYISSIPTLKEQQRIHGQWKNTIQIWL